MERRHVLPSPLLARANAREELLLLPREILELRIVDSSWHRQMAGEQLNSAAKFR